MEKDAKAMLEYLTDQNRNPHGYMMFVDFYDDYEEYSGLPEQTIMACMRYLEEKGYIKYAQDQHGKTVGFELEYKAHRKGFFRREEIKDFVLKSVIVPIAVTLLTLATVNFLRSALPEWLSQLLQQ